MTTETTTPVATPAPVEVRGNTWRPTFRGVLLSTWIKLLRRRPTRKGYIFYGLTVAAILGLGILVAVQSEAAKNSVPLELVLVLILGAGMLIGPSLSATSINGDSSEGVLAPLQMTRLSAGDLAIGKLLASWAVCFAALLTTTPFLVYAFSRSGWTFGELAVVLVVSLFIVLAFTAVGLAWSSIAARSVGSVSLTHITSGFMLLGTLLVFAFTTPLVSETVTVTYRDFDYDQMTEEEQMDPNFDWSTLPCVDMESEYTITHTDRTAWLLLINPAVVISETAPIVNPETYEEDGRAAPGIYAMIHQAVSEARMGPETPQGYDVCADEYGDENAWQERQTATATYPQSPWLGLAASGALLVGSMWIAVRRLHVPYKKLRTGTRVA